MGELLQVGGLPVYVQTLGLLLRSLRGFVHIPEGRRIAAVFSVWQTGEEENCYVWKNGEKCG